MALTFGHTHPGIVGTKLPARAVINYGGGGKKLEKCGSKTFAPLPKRGLKLSCPPPHQSTLVLNPAVQLGIVISSPGAKGLKWRFFDHKSELDEFGLNL